SLAEHFPAKKVDGIRWSDQFMHKSASSYSDSRHFALFSSSPVRIIRTRVLRPRRTKVIKVDPAPKIVGVKEDWALADSAWLVGIHIETGNRVSGVIPQKV